MEWNNRREQEINKAEIKNLRCQSFVSGSGTRISWQFQVIRGQNKYKNWCRKNFERDLFIRQSEKIFVCVKFSSILIEISWHGNVWCNFLINVNMYYNLWNGITGVNRRLTRPKSKIYSVKASYREVPHDFHGCWFLWKAKIRQKDRWRWINYRKYRSAIIYLHGSTISRFKKRKKRKKRFNKAFRSSYPKISQKPFNSSLIQSTANARWKPME